jgi:hypothetical protein
MMSIYDENKNRYINLKYQLGGKNKIWYTDDEISFVNQNIKHLIHWTSIDNFKKIMESMEIRSLSLTDKKRSVSDQYNYIVFATDIRTNSETNLSSFASFDDRSVGIIIDKNILFDDNVYYYYSPLGNRCSYFYDAISNHNIKKILYHKNKEKYINNLNINDNLRNGLLSFLGDGVCGSFNDEEISKTSTLDQMKMRGGSEPEREFCFFDRINLKYHMLGVDLSLINEEDRDEIVKIIPDDVEIVVQKIDQSMLDQYLESINPYES